MKPKQNFLADRNPPFSAIFFPHAAAFERKPCKFSPVSEFESGLPSCRCAPNPPYGPLVNATVIADGFSSEMVKYGWRTGFNLKDDDFNSTNLFPVLGGGSGQGTFSKYCHFGLVVGHMTATAYTDPDYYVTHSFIPVYNSKQPGRYQWLPLPGMDFGNGSSPLMWMALYGCNSLRYEDADDIRGIG